MCGCGGEAQAKKKQLDSARGSAAVFPVPRMLENNDITAYDNREKRIMLNVERENGDNGMQPY